MSRWIGEPPLNLVLVQTLVADNSAALDFETGLNDIHDHYEFRLSNIIPATSDTSLWIRFKMSGVYETTNYSYAGTISTPSAHAVQGSTASGAIFISGIGGSGGGMHNTGGNSISGVVTLHNPEAAIKPYVTFQTGWHAQLDGFVRSYVGTGGRNTSGAVTGVRFMISSGNITSGRISLCGYKKS